MQGITQHQQKKIKKKLLCAYLEAPYYVMNYLDVTSLGVVWILGFYQTSLAYTRFRLQQTKTMFG